MSDKIDRILGITSVGFADNLPAPSAASGRQYYVESLQDNFKSDGSVWTPYVNYLNAGIYVPVASALTNVGAASDVVPVSCQYRQLSNTVCVNGRLTSTLTSGTAASAFSITLPVTSAVTDGYLNGLFRNTTGTCNGVIEADSGKAKFSFTPSSSTAAPIIHFEFSYQVI